jgi:hypothetical protein
VFEEVIKGFKYISQKVVHIVVEEAINIQLNISAESCLHRD